MNRQMVAGFTVVALLASFDACLPGSLTRKTRTAPDDLLGINPYAASVVAIQKKSGERVTFPSGRRATIAGSWVLVPAPRGISPDAAGMIRVADEEIAGIQEDSRGRVVGVALKDGRFFRVSRAEKDEQGLLVGVAKTYRAIPFSDIDLIWRTRSNKAMMTFMTVSILASVVALAVFGTGGGGNTTPTPDESCPFVYSFDGRDYALDAEPYGAAISRGLERTEIVGLDRLKAVDGRYRLLLANELDETDHTDRISLVVVDHPRGVAVAPGVRGEMISFSRVLAPVRAADREGRDIRGLLAAKDETFWLGRLEGLDPESEAELKDELTLEFPRPAGAREARLLVNAWNTAWGARAARALVEARGTGYEAWRREVDARGPAFWKALDWFAREEMFSLVIRVETAAGWVAQGLIQGSGGVIAKDKAYPLDLSSVAGDTVRVRLTPAAGFWMIDRIGLDAAPSAPLRVVEVPPASAADQDGRDVRAELASRDGRYFDLPRAGCYAAIEFAAPPPAPGLERSVFVKATGYYDMNIDVTAPPDAEALAALDEPNGSLRYLLRRHPMAAKPGPRAARPKAPAH